MRVFRHQIRRLVATLVLATLATSGAAPAGHIAEKAKTHWAYQPIANPAPPASPFPDRVRNGIDPFIHAQLAPAGLSPAPPADPRTLIRRAHSALLGLPPSEADVQSFATDTTRDAWERRIDLLLASPHFGERWARHWLDVARYSDTKGYVFEESREYPYAYAYRDWVVRAFNDGMPYDQFLVYQLAADQVVPEDKPGLHRHYAAMGFLTVGRRFLNRQPDIIDDRLDVITRGTMAMTLACARCHDHKFDPIPTDDYYALYGVFSSSEEPKDLPLLEAMADSPERTRFEQQVAEKQNAVDRFIASKRAALRDAGNLKKYLLLAHEGREFSDGEFNKAAAGRKLVQRVAAKWRDTLKATANQATPLATPWHRLANAAPEDYPRILQELEDKPDSAHPRVLEVFRKTPPVKFEDVAAVYAGLLANSADADFRAVLDSVTKLSDRELYRALRTPDQQRIRRLRKAVVEFKARAPDAPPRGMVLRDKARPSDAPIFERGDPRRPGARVPRRLPVLLTGGESRPFEHGSGRLELAQGIASKDNPFTARVWANRVWGHVFGRPLVDTPSDFGLQSDPPSHPALLDHLATVLIESGWSTKQLIRYTMASATYRQSSIATDPGRLATADPENRLLSRMNRRKLDFESLRDSILDASGSLDHAIGGKPVALGTSDRRTLYVKVERQNLPGLMRNFDFASPDTHCPRRFETMPPQQALFLLNSPFAQRHAIQLVASLGIDKQPAEQQIDALYRRILVRQPDAEEHRLASEFLVSALPKQTSDWQYGYGRDGSFTALPHFTGEAWQAGPEIPHRELGWVTINKDGGHPDHNAVIWRWTAKMAGAHEIRATLEVPSAKSDGVVLQIARDTEILHEARIPGAQSHPVHLAGIELKPGQTLDFIVGQDDGPAFDTFNFSPQIRHLDSKESWIAHERFTGPTDSLSGLAQLAQALLSSNEFAFID